MRAMLLVYSLSVIFLLVYVIIYSFTFPNQRYKLNMDSTEKNNEVMTTKVSSETYYNSDDGFKYYSIINSVDYSGMGIWDEMVEHTDPFSKKLYKRGEGRSIRDATIERDKKMLRLIRQHMPDK